MEPLDKQLLTEDPQRCEVHPGSRFLIAELKCEVAVRLTGGIEQDSLVVNGADDPDLAIGVHVE